MTETKNLKVPVQTHEMLRKRAKTLGVKIFVLADAMLQVGLKMKDEELQRAVVNSQLLTPPITNTSQEPPEE